MVHAMNRLIATGLSILLALGPCSVAQAGVISTASAIDMQARHQQIERIDAFLARDDVRSALISRGVDPANAAQRVNALTDAEVEQLTLRVDQLPAGGIGVIGVVGIVGVVLLILELLGVTNVFTAF